MKRLVVNLNQKSLIPRRTICRLDTQRTFRGIATDPPNEGLTTQLDATGIISQATLKNLTTGNLYLSKVTISIPDISMIDEVPEPSWETFSFQDGGDFNFQNGTVFHFN